MQRLTTIKFIFSLVTSGCILLDSIGAQGMNLGRPLPQPLTENEQPALSSTKAILNLIELDAQSRGHRPEEKKLLKKFLPEFRGKSYFMNVLSDPKSPEGFLLRHISIKMDKKHHDKHLQISSIFYI